MNNTLAPSIISNQELQSWEALCKEIIEDGVIQALDVHQTKIAIDQLAYRLATEAYNLFASGLNYSPPVDNIDETLVDIQFTIAVGSGIYPTTLSELINVRVKHYSNEYIRAHNNRMV
jgi:hypothetical protein